MGLGWQVLTSSVWNLGYSLICYYIIIIIVTSSAITFTHKSDVHKQTIKLMTLQLATDYTLFQCNQHV